MHEKIPALHPVSSSTRTHCSHPRQTRQESPPVRRTPSGPRTSARCRARPSQRCPHAACMWLLRQVWVPPAPTGPTHKVSVPPDAKILQLWAGPDLPICQHGAQGPTARSGKPVPKSRHRLKIFPNVNLIYDTCQFNSSIFVSKQLKTFITICCYHSIFVGIV